MIMVPILNGSLLRLSSTSCRAIYSIRPQATYTRGRGMPQGTQNSQAEVRRASSGKLNAFAGTCQSARALLGPDAVFSAAMVAVIPLYTIMVAFPKCGIVSHLHRPMPRSASLTEHMAPLPWYCQCAGGLQSFGLWLCHESTHHSSLRSSSWDADKAHLMAWILLYSSCSPVRAPVDSVVAKSSWAALQGGIPELLALARRESHQCFPSLPCLQASMSCTVQVRDRCVRCDTG